MCPENKNAKWAFVRQCNYDAKKNNDPDFKTKGGNQKVSVGAGGVAYGITIVGNAKSAQKTMTQFQNIFEEDVPEAEEEVRKDIGVFKGFEFKTTHIRTGLVSCRKCLARVPGNPDFPA